MKIDEACINHNVVRIIDKIVVAPYMLLNENKDDRHNKMLIMYGEIKGALEMAKALKEVLKT